MKEYCCKVITALSAGKFERKANETIADMLSKGWHLESHEGINDGLVLFFKKGK